MNENNRTVNVIRHMAFEDLGYFETLLKEKGFVIQYIDAGIDELSVIEDSGDLLVILGGPISVNDTDEFPFLQEEIERLRNRIQADQLTLGICLGAQLIARALGAKVYPGPEKEIGWSRLHLTDAGAKSALSVFDNDVRCLHWHGETFDLPEGALHLASSDAYNNQAFSVGQNTLALQFHPEVTAGGLVHWFVGHKVEIDQTPGISVEQLREDTLKYSSNLKIAGEQFLERWCEKRKI